MRIKWMSMMHKKYSKSIYEMTILVMTLPKEIINCGDEEKIEKYMFEEGYLV